MTDNKKPKKGAKRGRKPKGGKIITVTENISNDNNNISNVIVHLKCKNNNKNIIDNEPQPINTSQNDNLKNINDKKNSIKSLNEKLKQLQYRLHNNEINKTTVSCFWCTYNFNNIPIYIPKFELNGTYHVYGCFCSPECACAFLMNESIESSVKFERYTLLNHLYCNIYDYDKNIKCAPNPYYTLEKYYGNLTIDEYRNLLSSYNHLLIIDKPIVRELPELHEDNKSISTFKYYNNNNNNNVFKAFLGN